MGFGPPGGPMMGGGASFNPLAIVSMILGILSIPSCCCWFMGWPLAVGALVCGIVGMMKIKGNPQAWKGSGMAITGIVCGSIGLLLDLAALFTTFDEQLRHQYGGGHL
jgi:hypothetical protein